MAVNDLYELTLRGRLMEQEVSNVFGYRQRVDFVTTEPNFAAACIAAFEEQTLPDIAAIVSLDVLFTNIECRNLFDPSDASESIISVPGTVGLTGSEDTVTSFLAYDIELDGDNPAVRSGRKRFAGVADRHVVDGMIATGGDLDEKLQTLCDQLSKPLTSTLGVDQLFDPVIIGRVRNGTPGHYTYRLPTNSSEAVWSTIVVAVFNLLVTSQISRKIGRGS